MLIAQRVNLLNHVIQHYIELYIQFDLMSTIM